MKLPGLFEIAVNIYHCFDSLHDSELEMNGNVCSVSLRVLLKVGQSHGAKETESVQPLVIWFHGLGPVERTIQCVH